MITNFFGLSGAKKSKIAIARSLRAHVRSQKRHLEHCAKNKQAHETAMDSEKNAEGAMRARENGERA